MGQRILLVEGDDDLHVIAKLCKCCDIPETFSIVECGGYDKLLESIPVRIKGSDIDVLGIVVDADEDIEARWKSIHAKLAQAGYSSMLPPKPLPEGVLFESSSGAPLLPRIGIWLMPDNQTPGILENFVSFLVPDGDRLWPVAEKAVADIPHELVRYKKQYKPKANIHTYLAWQEEPGKPMGQSITKGVLNPKQPVCLKFVAWLKRVFE